MGIEEKDTITMPFSGHHPDELLSALRLMAESELAAELFDVFLAEYKQTGDVGQSIWAAQCEWDC